MKNRFAANGAAPSRRASAREGFALITVVLLMIGMAFLTTGLLFATAQHATLVASSHDVLRARHAAEAALAAMLADWNSAARSLDPVGRPLTLLEAVDLESGVRMAGRAERLDADFFLLTATGTMQRAGTLPIEQSAARVVRSMDAFAVGRSLDAAAIVTQASLAGGSEVRGGDVAARPSDSAAAALCAAWSGVAAAVRAHPDSLSASPDAGLFGYPPYMPDAGTARFRVGMGFLDRAALVTAARRIEPTSTQPVSHWPLLHVPADLALDGGYHQGILLADRDLVLDGGVLVRGILMVEGTVTIRDARVEGVLIARRLRMDGGVASLDRCAVASALADAPFLRRAHPPARSWLPAFD